MTYREEVHCLWELQTLQVHEVQYKPRMRPYLVSVHLQTYSDIRKITEMEVIYLETVYGKSFQLSMSNLTHYPTGKRII